MTAEGALAKHTGMVLGRRRAYVGARRADALPPCRLGDQAFQRSSERHQGPARPGTARRRCAMGRIRQAFPATGAGPKPPDHPLDARSRSGDEAPVSTHQEHGGSIAWRAGRALPSLCGGTPMNPEDVPLDQWAARREGRGGLGPSVLFWGLPRTGTRFNLLGILIAVQGAFTTQEFLMTVPFGSQTKTLIRSYRGALAVVVAVLALAACDPAAPASTPSASPSVSVSASPSSGPSAGVSASVGASSEPSAMPSSARPSVSPTTARPTPTVSARSVAPATKAAPAPPAPTRSRTPAPAAEPTKASTDCYPRSNAGNCYKAGQICRKADVGTSGRDANGRAIQCRRDDSVGQRWGY